MAGYDELSVLMGSFPELAMFRRFKPLAAKLLTCMQAELLDLEEDLQVIEEVDFADPKKRDLLQSWAKTNQASDEHGASQRRLKIAELLTKLERYYAFALQIQQVLAVKRPQRRDFNSLNEWISSKQGGDHFLAKVGIEGKAWDRQQFDDLMALKQQDDCFAQWLSNTFLPTYHRRVGNWLHRKIEHDNLGELWHYKEEHFILCGNVMAIFLATTLPSSCIFALYYAQGVGTRLVLTACFSLVFSMLMTFVIQARRQDVLAVTIALALAAVQVVFVGNVTSVQTNKGNA